MYLTVSTHCPNCSHRAWGAGPEPVSGLWRCQKDQEGQTVRNVDRQHLGCMSFIERMHNWPTNLFSARQWGWQPVTWDANASHGPLALWCTPLCTKFSLERKGCQLPVSGDVTSYARFRKRNNFDNVPLFLHNKSSVFSLASTYKQYYCLLCCCWLLVNHVLVHSLDTCTPQIQCIIIFLFFYFMIVIDGVVKWWTRGINVTSPWLEYSLQPFHATITVGGNK